MKGIHFQIEAPNSLSFTDFQNLRKLYLPIIGANSLVIYEYFSDLSLKRLNNLYNLDDFCALLQINTSIFKESLQILEAVGLIRTYKKNNDDMFIFKVIIPNDVEAFDKNPLLKSHVIKLIGKDRYQDIYLEQKEKFLNKNTYKEISKKYQDVFSKDFEESLTYTSDEIYTTKDVKVDLFKTHDENIEKLASTHFIKYMMKRNASWYETLFINSLLKMGFIDSGINLLIDYSIRTTNLVNCNYLKAIANDFKNRKIIKFDDIKHELSLIEEYKTLKHKKPLVSEITNDEPFFFSNSENNSYQSTTKELSIEEIFSDLSDEEIKKIY